MATWDSGNMGTITRECTTQVTAETDIMKDHITTLIVTITTDLTIMDLIMGLTTDLTIMGLIWDSPMAWFLAPWFQTISALPRSS